MMSNIRSRPTGFATTFRLLLAVAAAWFGTGCGAGTPTSPGGPAVGGTSLGLVVAVAGEPRTLVPTASADPPGPAKHLFEIVHQSLVTYTAQGQPTPRVAAMLPSLDDGTWLVNGDGTMETVWHLRPGISWHDGYPLTPDDVVFGWRVFNSSAVPVVSRRAAQLIDRMEAVDATTLRIHWRAHYAFANQLTGYDLTLLPAHLLQTTFELRPELVAGSPYWQSSFVGLGPYRLAHWLAGSSTASLHRSPS